VPVYRNKDEIGEMTEAFSVFRDSMIERAEMQIEQNKARELKLRRQDEIDQLVGIFGNTMRGVFRRVSDTSATMSGTASTLFDNSSMTTEQTTVLTQEADETANTVASVSSAAEELTASIGEIQNRVEHSAEIANRAMNRAEAIGKSFGELLSASHEITSVVDLIKEIAGQTNLLALNATIEAARAGEAGKGFAVVASEVKELATQTAKATGQISDQVDAVQRTAKDVEDSMGEINQTIAEIHEVSASITDAVSGQQLATSEIARSVEVVATSARRVGDSIDVVRGSAEQGRDGARDVKDGADVLNQEATSLGSEVETFLTALSSKEDEDTFEIHDVSLAAEIHVAGKIHKTHVRRISTAFAIVAIQLPAEAGEPVTIQIDGIPEPVKARLAGSDAGGSQIQFPLDFDHISAMGEHLALLKRRRAA
jgi:methyl-accepting chemotaxis protein